MQIILRKVLRDLRARLAQTVALVTITALGVASFIALVGAYRDLGTSYNRTYAQLKFASVAFSVDSAPQEVLDQVAAVDGVESASGRLILDTGFILPEDALENAGQPVRARLIGIPAGAHPVVNDVLVLSGRYFQPGDGDSVLVESHFADIYDLQPGDTVMPLINGQETSFKILGIIASPEYLIVSPSRQDILPSARTFAVLFVPLPALQDLAGAPGALNNFAVRLSPGADQDAAIRDIQALLQPYNLRSTTLQADQPSNAALQLDLEGYREIAYLMPTLILLVAAISVYVMLGRQVYAQRPQIGLMKALGYSDRAVMGHYLALALVIGLVGSAAGVLIGLPLVRFITESYAAELGIPLVQTRFYPDLAAAGVMLSLFVAALAGIGPARRSARVQPAIAMRQDPASALVSGRKSFFEKLFRLPLGLRLPLRDVFRVRRRSLTTALGIVFAYMLVLMALGMFDSMRYMLDNQFNNVERWDMQVSFDSPQMPSTLDQVQSLPGVREAEPLIQLPATLKLDGEEDDLLLIAFRPEQDLHRLALTGGERPSDALGGDRIVLTDATATKFGLKPGDQVTVITPFGTKALSVGGITSELMGAAAYISLDAALSWSGSPVPVFNGVYLKVDPGEVGALKKALYRLPGAAGVQVNADVRQDWQSLMGLFYAFMGVILIFALLMAFALLFNAMTVNVLERERELATMRAFGTGMGRIAGMLTAENVLLWTLTLVPGLVLGWLVARQMGAAFQSDLFAFHMVISPLSYLLTALGILATMMIATAPPLRRVARLDLAEATKVLT